MSLHLCLSPKTPVLPFTSEAPSQTLVKAQISSVTAPRAPVPAQITVTGFEWRTVLYLAELKGPVNVPNRIPILCVQLKQLHFSGGSTWKPEARGERQAHRPAHT